MSECIIERLKKIGDTSYTMTLEIKTQWFGTLSKGDAAQLTWVSWVGMRLGDKFDIEGNDFFTTMERAFDIFEEMTKDYKND